MCYPTLAGILAGSCGLGTSTTLTLHKHLCSVFFFLQHPHLFSAQEECREKCFLRPPLTQDSISLEYSQGYWVTRRGNGWDLSVPFKPKPNTSPDFAQTIRKGNLAPGKIGFGACTWHPSQPSQNGPTRWDIVSPKKVCGGVKCKSIPEPTEYKKTQKTPTLLPGKNRFCVIFKMLFAQIVRKKGKQE